MTLKCLATGSTGNCYILTNSAGKHLILDAGIPIAEIKKGLDFDIENVEACIVTHGHKDHALSVDKLKQMELKVWQPYLADQKRMRTTIGDFKVECFDVPHNGVENRAFLISADNITLLYSTDFEYIPYNLSQKQINVMLIELNYQSERITELDEHRRHTVLGHAEEQTTIGVMQNTAKYLRKVILCHMSKSGGLDRELAMKNIRNEIPDYIDVVWAKPNKTEDISECPF